MTAKIKRVITVESWQRTVIRQHSRQTVWCKFCAAQVESLAPEQAAVIFGIRLREIYRQIETGTLHFIKSKNDSLFICINSLKTNK